MSIFGRIVGDIFREVGKAIEDEFLPKNNSSDAAYRREEFVKEKVYQSVMRAVNARRRGSYVKSGYVTFKRFGLNHVIRRYHMTNHELYIGLNYAQQRLRSKGYHVTSVHRSSDIKDNFAHLPLLTINWD